MRSRSLWRAVRRAAAWGVVVEWAVRSYGSNARRACSHHGCNGGSPVGASAASRALGIVRFDGDRRAHHAGIDRSSTGFRLAERDGLAPRLAGLAEALVA